MLTARDSLVERVKMLNLGADDFLAKPFELAELEARLHALVRRARGIEHPRLACGALSLDVGRKQFVCHGESLSMSPREYAVLQVLIQHSGEPMSKQQIIDRVFPDDQDVHPEAVEVLSTGCASGWTTRACASQRFGDSAMFWKKFRQAPLRHSLFFLLLPVLATITCAELWMTDRDALDAANSAYDRSLLGAVKSIAGNISTSSGGLSVELPYRLFEYFELTASGQVYFRVATSDGLVELGSADLPASPVPLVLGSPVFYDAAYFGESVRLVALLVQLEAQAGRARRATC
jgi:CheY-like chemotaxis protein